MHHRASTYECFYKNLVKTQLYETNSYFFKMDSNPLFFDIVHSTKNGGGNLCEDLFARAARRKLHTLAKKGLFFTLAPNSLLLAFFARHPFFFLD